MSVENVNKITVKNLVGALSKPSEAKHLITVAGVVRSIEDKTTVYGDTKLFRGEFGARTNDGKEFRSYKAYFPNNLVDAIVAGFNGEPLEFVAHIGIRPADTKTGYEYTLEVPRAEGAESRVDALLASNQHAIAAPKGSKAK